MRKQPYENKLLKNKLSNKDNEIDKKRAEKERLKNKNLNPTFKK